MQQCFDDPWLSPASPMRQLPLDLGPGERAGLGAFLPGGNGELLAWLQGWPESQPPDRPTYLWGMAGAGKSHLLRALVHQALDLGWRVLWLDGGGFQSWEGRVSDGVEAPSLVILDDCGELDAQQQQWAFQLFIEQASLAAEGDSAGMAIVAAGRVPSVDLVLREDLKTRLGWGLSFAVHALDEAGIRDVLHQEAQRRGMGLGDGVVSYMLTHLHRNMGHLMALIERLDRYALAEQRLITVPLLKQMLALESP